MKSNTTIAKANKQPLFFDVKELRQAAMKNCLEITYTNEIKLNTNEYVMMLSIQGLEQNDFVINFKNKLLNVAVLKNEPLCSKKQMHSKYKFYKWFKKIVLPDDADPQFAKANYAKGKLIIQIPKTNRKIVNDDVEIFVY